VSTKAGNYEAAKIKNGGARDSAKRRGIWEEKKKNNIPKK
jgi:hypothetical protein